MSQKTIPAQQKAMESANLKLARVMLEHPEVYAGIQLAWAIAVIERAKTA